MPIVPVQITREVTTPDPKPAFIKGDDGPTCGRAEPAVAIDIVVIQEVEMEGRGVNSLLATEHRSQTVAGSSG